MTMLEKAQTVYDETKTALETVLAELNHGQRQKLMNNEKVRELLDRYGVQYDG